jgi:hypothetical protein
MSERLIKNTRHAAQYPWPEDTYVQGGDHGVVFSPDRDPYRTAFVEAFPGDTFLRGEGATIAEAEDKCWKQFLRWRDCDGSGQGHGPYERRQYRNGAGFCTRCGIWMNRVFPELPEDPERPKNLLEKAFSGDRESLTTILDAVANAEDLPKGTDS